MDKYTFLGSSAVGKEVGKLAADELKPCTLELGGKSAAIILEDAGPGLVAADAAVRRADELRSGLCGADPDLAPRSRYDEIVEKIGAAVATGYRSDCPTPRER